MGRVLRKPLQSLVTLFTLVFLIDSLAPVSLSQTPASSIAYQRQVHSILATNCLGCHNQEKRSGGLSLATYQDVLAGGRSGAIVKPGKSAGSRIIERITAQIEPRMPLGGQPLSASEIAIIRKWIDQGARETPTSAPAKARWEPQLTLDAPPVPASPWKNWNSPVDRFTAQYLAAHKIAEPSIVSDAEFARRAYLDVWGLLPDPRQLQGFLADPHPDKRRRLIDRLLSDNQKYSENWISYWDDLLRNDEGVAYYSETANRKSITPWLLNALETNKPYKQWITELLNPTKATDPDGFLIGVNWRGTVSASQTPALQASQNTAQIFLGINLKCNSCHDSFISKWKLKDAYALASYFSTEQKLQLYRCDVAQNQFATASFLYPELNRPLPSDSVENRRAAIAEIFTDPRNGRMPRTLVNRIWQKLMGRGFVEDVDDLDGEPWSPQLLDWLASDFVSSGYDLKHLLATIISSRTYQLPAVPRKGDQTRGYTFRGPEIRRLTAEEFADAVASITGDWHVSPPVKQRAAASRSGDNRVVLISGAPRDGADVVPVRPNGNGIPAKPTIGRPPATHSSVVPAPEPIPGGNYAREWRIAANSLTRALGRPIRDQVYSTRDSLATTVQALELVNGDALNHWLWRGARRMLGQLPPEPESLLARQISGGRDMTPVPFDIDISKSQKLYLIVEDNLSTAPDKATPIWLNATLEGRNGSVALTSLKPFRSSDLREGSGPVMPAGSNAPAANALRVKFPSVLVYDISGKGFTRFHGAPGLENVSLGQGESVIARFFVFDRQPSMDRLVPPNPGTPLPPEPTLKTIPETVNQVYWYALGRAPSADERRIAEAALRSPSEPGKPSADGLADLLWAILMTPEFQLVR